MSDPNPVSKTQKQKKPGGAKSEKVVLPHKYLNANPFVWSEDLGWQDLGLLSEQNPYYHMTLFSLAVGDYDEPVNAWSSILETYYEKANAAQFYRTDSYFYHFWMSRIVEWHGYALHSMAHAKAMRESEGTTFSHPYGQRIDSMNDGKRITAADRAGAEAERKWVEQFP